MTSSDAQTSGGFDRTAFDAGTLHIGTGEIGGKATGLTFFSAMLGAEYEPATLPGIDVTVPPYAVLTTSVFDAFIGQDALKDLDFEAMPDEDIASAFQAAPLPDDAMDFLTALVNHVTVPLAVRSSSLLEDAIFHPLAGVYETKMVPNNQPDTEVRLRKMVEAVRFVYASTRFKNARDYLRAVGKDLADEKMALVVQEVVGSIRGNHFYPHVSGVARSHNFYPTAGARAEEGVVSLALGLGKTIVDGGVCWTYSPARPTAPPPFASVGDLMKSSQLHFWAVNLSPHDDGVFSESEHLVQLDLDQAEQDGVLDMVASTYVPASDRVVPGTGSAGPRILNFGPLLQLNLLPLNAVIRELLAICERAAGADVEIEFAVSVDPQTRQARFGFLQVRPMFVSNETVDIPAEEFRRPDLFLAAG